MTEIVALDPVVLTEIVALDPITLNATLGRAGLWVGHGPPGTIVGAVIGDEYLDDDSGTLYTLNPGA